MSDEREDAVERALTALGRARVPEGLDARVLARLERRGGLARADAGMSAAWWRGALSGAVFAMVCVGLVMLAQHGLRVRMEPGKAVVRGGAAHGVLAAASVGGEVVGRGGPCLGAGLVQVGGVVHGQGAEKMKVASVEWTTAVADAPLTAQERELVRLARHGDVQELATALNPEVRARLDAEDAASYQSFFAAPTPINTEEPRSAEPGAEGPAVETPASEPPASEPISTEPVKSQPSKETSTGENQ
jgi:hypothetical protein